MTILLIVMFASKFSTIRNFKQAETNHLYLSCSLNHGNRLHRLSARQVRPYLKKKRMRRWLECCKRKKIIVEMEQEATVVSLQSKVNEYQSIIRQKLISVSEGMGDESLARLLQEEEELTRKRTGGRSSGPPPTRTPMLKSKVILPFVHE